jgi:neutral trehalase
LWEKYDTLTGAVSVAKEYESPEMLGWTAGVYLACLDVLAGR